MPWRGPEFEGEFPTLGYAIGEWIEDLCVIPDGDRQGQPFRLSDTQLEFILWMYRLRPDAKPGERGWMYGRGAQLIGPQKWGKGPLAAAITAAEADGPAVFDGWDAYGEPVGRQWSTPWIQVTAVSEAQTANVWRALMPMIELGPLAGTIPDVGETRINLREGGRIERVTASARSRLGQRLTFAVQDEGHDWTAHNGGRKLADTQRRNLAGMGGRFLETGNAWDPTEQSVAQQTAESVSGGVYRMHLDGGPGDITKSRARRRVLKRVYGGCDWIDLDRIEAEVEELVGRNDIAQAERFFCNRVVQSVGKAYDHDRWKACRADREAPDGSQIVIGVDGARFHDSLAVIATHVESGHQWPLGIWERPDNAPDGYEHPLDEVDGAVADAFERYQVWRLYADPQYIEALIDRWQGRYGEKRVISWYTNRPKPMAYAVRTHVTAVTAGDLTHNGDTTFTAHVGRAVRLPVTVYDDDRQKMWALAKPSEGLKIDAATAAVLSWEARGDAIAAGALEDTHPEPLIAFT